MAVLRSQTPRSRCPHKTGHSTICPSGDMAPSIARFYVPEGVDADKIEASFKNGVLTVTLPKSAEAQQKQRQIAVKKG